jgi:hypothetical protein
MILVFDNNGQVVWTWDAFDHLDVQRQIVLADTCDADGCASTYLEKNSQLVIDWTHGTSVQEAPDGNLVFSLTHQDWVIKIAYEKGEGDGHIVWKLGQDGDFSTDLFALYPWFSHQHDSGYAIGDKNLMVLFDNGNTRYALDQSQNSRGMALRIDEANRTVHVEFVHDFGLFYTALGSAQATPTGNFYFNLGWVPGEDTSRAIEFDADGNCNKRGSTLTASLRAVA